MLSGWALRWWTFMRKRKILVSKQSRNSIWSLCLLFCNHHNANRAVAEKNNSHPSKTKRCCFLQTSYSRFLLSTIQIFIDCIDLVEQQADFQMWRSARQAHCNQWEEYEVLQANLNDFSPVWLPCYFLVYCTSAAPLFLIVILLERKTI